MSADSLDDVTIITEESAELLNQRQRVDYETHREHLITWLANIGRDPDQGKGYAIDTVRRRAVDIDRFYRYVWDTENGYTTQLSTTHADDYTQELAYSDYSNSYKRNMQKSIESCYRWRARELGGTTWEPEITFVTSGQPAQPRDFFSKAERAALREAALDYGSVPHYNSLTPSERTDWKRHLAKRFQKPMTDIGKQDFERANGWKEPSLVHASLDAGLRPVEVKRARTTWVDTDNAVLRIPHTNAAKSDLNWTVTLREQTAEFLGRWLDERTQYEKYEHTDRLWLTRERNPYDSSALSYLLTQLCDHANIDADGRSLSWYAIRHSLGTAMTDVRGLAATQSQLRHSNSQTTLKYDNASHEQRRDALNNIG